MKDHWIIPSTLWPALKVACSGCISYRIRSARIVWTPVDQDLHGSVGILVTHTAASWKPADSFHDLKTRGGIIKPMKSAGWSSNTMDPDQEWYDPAVAAAKVWILCVPKLPSAGTPATSTKEFGMITGHFTVQLRGYKE